MLWGVIVGLVSWYSTPQNLSLILFTENNSDQSSYYWNLRQGNISRLKDSGLFHSVNSLSNRLLVENQKDFDEYGTNIIYVDGRVRIDENENVLLFVEQNSKEGDDTLITLDLLMNWIGSNLRNHCVLVLNIYEPDKRFITDDVQNNISDVIKAQIKKFHIEKLIVLMPNQYAEPDIAIPGRGIGLFVHFLVEGLKGAADPFTGKLDGKVTSASISKYLSSRVNYWTRQFGFRKRDIFTWTSARDEFHICYSGLTSKEDLALTLSLRPYPQWLADSWKTLDQWKSQNREEVMPQLISDLQDGLLNAEQLWSNGFDDSPLKEKTTNFIEKAEKFYQDFSSIPRPHIYSLGWYKKLDDSEQITNRFVENLTNHLSLLRISLDNPEIKKEEFTKLVKMQADKWKASLPADIDITRVSATIAEVASVEKWRDANELDFYISCMNELKSEPIIESIFLKQLANLYKEESDKYPVSLLFKIYKTKVNREELLAQGDIWPDLIAYQKSLLMKQHEIELMIVKGSRSSAVEIEKIVDLINIRFESVIADINTFKKAKKVLYQGFLDLRWIPQIISWNAMLEEPTLSYVSLLVRLTGEMEKLECNQDSILKKDRFSRSAGQNEDDEVQVRAVFTTELILLIEAIQSTRNQIWMPLSDNAISEYQLQISSLSPSSSPSITDLLKILRFPACSTDLRRSTWRLISDYLERKGKEAESIQVETNSFLHEIDINDNRTEYVPDNLDARIRLFTKFTKFLTETAPINDPLTSVHPKDSTKDYHEVTKESTLQLLNEWKDHNFRLNKYSNTIKECKPLMISIERLFQDYRIFDSLESKLIQDYRSKRIIPFYKQLFNILNYFEIDFDSDTITRQALDSLKDLSKAENTFDLNINVKPISLMIDDNEQFRADCKLKIDASIDHNLKDGDYIEFEFINQPGTSFKVSSTPQKYNVAYNDNEDSLNNLYTISLEKDLVIHAFPHSDSESLSNQIPIDFEHIVILRTKINGWNYHTFIPLTINWKSLRPIISFNKTSDRPNNSSSMSLRPLSGIQNRFIKITNPSYKTRTYQAKFIFKNEFNNEELRFDSESVSIGPGETKTVKVLRSKEKDNNDNNVQVKNDSISQNEIRDKKQSQWPGSAIPVNPQYLIQIFDVDKPASEPVLIQDGKLTIQSPLTYIRMGNTVFTPSSQRLSIELNPVVNTDDSLPAVIQLKLPVINSDNPDFPLESTGGKLEGSLNFTSSKGLNILAEPIKIRSDRNGSNARFHLNVDDYLRAFNFQNRWIIDGDASFSPMPIISPEIHLNVKSIANTGQPLNLIFEPINESDESQILLEVAKQEINKDLVFQTVHRFNTSRRERFAIATDEKTGAFQINTDFGDWSYDLQSTGLIGNILLKASLLDKSGKVVSTDQKTVLFDDQKPRNSTLLNLPQVVRIGSKLKLVLATTPPESGIAEAKVFLGLLKDAKPPANTELVSLSTIGPDLLLGQAPKSSNTNLQYWTGELNIPNKADLVGDTSISVIITTNSGEVQSFSDSIKLVESNHVENGIISGSVRLGDRPLPNLPVVLRKMDKKRTEITRTQTDNFGTFRFDSIPPGKYGIFSARSIDQTSAQSEVIVQSGQNTAVTLTLGRVNLPSNGPAPVEDNSLDQEPAKTK